VRIIREEVITTAIEIRAFEQFLLEGFQQGLLRGTTHTCIGQELTPSIIGKVITKRNFLVSNHRNHGFFIGTGGSSRLLLREIAGKPNGVSKGLGGSQHIHAENFLSHGILGGLTPFAVGKGIGRRLLDRSTDPIILHIGDGTFGEGIVYESLNLAMIFKSSLLVIVEDNQVSQSTDTRSVIYGNILDRCNSLVSRTKTVSDQNYAELTREISDSLTWTIQNKQTSLIVVETKRRGPHSKGISSIDPWLGESDSVFKASISKSKAELRKRSIQIYEQTRQLFMDELGEKIYSGNFDEDWVNI